MQGRNSKGQFIKGYTSWQTGTKGLMKNSEHWYEVMKGRPPWNKGKTKADFPQLSNSGVKRGSKGNRTGIPNSLETRQRLSKALKGRVSPNKGKSMPWLSGKNHWSWKGGITPLNKRIRDCQKYLIWRQSCFERDNWICQNCDKRGGNLEVNHKKEFSLVISTYNIRTFKEALNCTELWNLDNGETLCRPCHDLVPSTHRRKRDELGKFIGL